jgi:type IV secretory pathway VirD2 relaxase
VRVTYARNGTKGLWRAHGRYLAREGASREKEPAAAGFDRDGGGVDISQRLGEWQAFRDERLWKVIVSPEFGERIDLDRLTRDVLRRMEQDLGTRLEWAAVAHYNTDHPHVHVAVRGCDENGRPLRLERNYIRAGIRGIAEDFCTRQLGHRTSLDAVEAERREVAAARFTSLDRQILQRSPEPAEQVSPYFRVATPEGPGSRERHLRARLAALNRMGLAEPAAFGTWRVRSDLEAMLHAMQRMADRQKVLSAHGVLMSDERLPIGTTDPNRLDLIEGRVLAHGEDELTGTGYVMLEGTEARVHAIPYTPDIEEARSRGLLRPNSFIKLQRLMDSGRPFVDVVDLGDSELLLKGPHVVNTARQLLKRGILPTEDGWSGWLGRYQKALREAAERLQEQRVLEAERQTKRSRRRSLGR